MKSFLYWFMGERAGRTIVGSWHWLWSLPMEAGGPIAVEVAQESLQSMQQTVNNLTASVAQVVAAHERAKAKYQEKLQEFRRCEQKARQAQGLVQEEAARLAMGNAILLEQVLPQLEVQVTKAEAIMVASKDKLRREQQRLENYKVQMQNLKALAEVNEALASIAQVQEGLGLDSARDQFEAAQGAVQNRYFQVQARAELSENPSEQLAAELEKMTLDEEITRRLQQLAPNDHPKA